MANWKHVKGSNPMRARLSAFVLALAHAEAAGWSLPVWLEAVDCDPLVASNEAEAVAIYKTLSFALPEALENKEFGSNTSDKDSGCLFWKLLRSRPDVLLFQLLRQQPVLSLVLSDLSALATTMASEDHGDLTLEPWFQAHCRGEPGRCEFSDLRSAVMAQEAHWKHVANGLYIGLQPHHLDVQRGATDATSIAVVGSHSGLSLGVSNALLEALDAQVQLAYFGHWAWCQNVENCQEPMALIFQEYQQDWAESEDFKNEEKYQKLLLQLSSFLQTEAPPDLLEADLLLCTRPFLFCWLLRELWPSGMQQVPMLHYYSGPLLFDTTPSQKTAVLEAFRQTVLSSDLDLMVSSSVLQSAWMLSMAHIAVPHVRPHATNLRGLYVPPKGQLNDIRALVLRSTWVGSIMAQAFQKVFGEMDADKLSGVTLEWLVSGKFLSYQEIADFHAAVFFPEQPDKLTFWEQYEMAMPLWLPSATWWSKIHAVGEFRYSVFAQRWFAQLPTAEALKSCFPQPVFFETDDFEKFEMNSPLAPIFWYALTDYALFPHLQHFDSAAELVKGLLKADLEELHREMAIFNEATWQRSASFYRAGLASLMSARSQRIDHGLTIDFLQQPSDATWKEMCDMTADQKSYVRSYSLHKPIDSLAYRARMCHVFVFLFVLAAFQQLAVWGTADGVSTWGLLCFASTPEWILTATGDEDSRIWNSEFVGRIV